MDRTLETLRALSILVVMIVSAYGTGFRLQRSQLVCIRLDEGAHNHADHEYG